MRDGRTIAVSPMKEISKLQLVASMLGRDLAEVKKKGATAFEGGGGKIGGELLSAEHVAVGHRVRDASIDIRRGEIVGLAGLLGSGRTETARAIFAADRKSSAASRSTARPRTTRALPMPSPPAWAIAPRTGRHRVSYRA